MSGAGLPGSGLLRLSVEIQFVSDFVDALVCTSPGSLVIERRPPPTMSKGDVLVRPRRIGVCGTDYHILQGKHPFLDYPRVMGHELAVEVVEAPAGSGWSTGETCVVNPYISCGHCITCRAGKPNCCVNIAVLGVHRDGGMTTLLTLPARNLVRADGLALDQCAAVEFLAIGAHAVRRAQVAYPDKVLVVGAGPIGLGVALFAALTGASVTILDLDAERLASVTALLGVAAIVGGDGATDAITAATSGEGFVVVFDATGNPISMEASFSFVAPGGRYVLVSVVRGAIAFEDPDFHRKEMTLLASRNATSIDFDQVIDAMRQGSIDVARLITHRTILAGAVHDLPTWATQKHGLIKAIIEL